MSEMPPLPPTPPPPEGFEPDEEYPAQAAIGAASVRWSKTAVTGFVLSLIGCLGLTAALGLVFGFFGLLATRGRRLRGRGLAIAALPVSVLTGTLFVVGLLLYGMAGELRAVHSQLGTLLKTESARTSAAISTFRTCCSPGFNAEVQNEPLLDWFNKVQAAHGTLVQMSPPKPSNDSFAFHFDAEFVRGKAQVDMFYVLDGRHLRLDDIEIDGSSPRRPD